MSTFRIASVALGSALFLCAGCPTRGSGNRSEESREIEAFDALEVSSSVDVFVRAGAAPTARIVGDDNLLSLVQTDVVGDTLEVKTSGSYVTGSGLEVHLTVPSLTRIEVSGSSSVHAIDLDAEELAVVLSGSGDLVASGRSTALEAAISGAGDLDTTALTAKDVEIAVSGSGDAKVTATSSLEATVSGSGSVRYQGEPPNVEKSASGSGTIEPL